MIVNHKSIVTVLTILALTSKELTAKPKQLVSVQHFTKGSSGLRDHICSGVLMTRRVVLTGCSCVTKFKQDPTTSRKTAALMDRKRIVVYIGTVMNTRSMEKTKNGEVQKVDVIYIHPLCDGEFAYDFAVVFTEELFTLKGLTVAKVLHRPDKIREYVIGLLDYPKACSTFSWMTDSTKAPCVINKYNEKLKFSLDEVVDDFLKHERLRGRNSTSLTKRVKREGSVEEYEVIQRKIPRKYFVKNRIDVDFVDQKYCTNLVSVCHLNPHGCIKGIHGLRCGEWCMRSLDCTERLCRIDTGSPVFCDKILVGIATRSRVVDCEGPNQVMAIVSGFDSALQFVRTSLASYNGKKVRKNLADASPRDCRYRNPNRATFDAHYFSNSRTNFSVIVFRLFCLMYTYHSVGDFLNRKRPGHQ